MGDLTNEQKSVMKPWAITAIAASLVRLVALALFCVYLFRAQRPILHGVIIWTAAIIFIPHILVVICTRKITRYNRNWQEEALWILTVISILCFVALAYLTW